MSATNIVKKNIARDWLEAFPTLSLYSQNRFYKIIGPLIVGLELINIPYSEGYRPHFIVNALWTDNAKDAIERTLILTEIRRRLENQFLIPYNNHEQYFTEAVECVRQQVKIPLDHDVRINAFFRLIEDHAKKPPLSAAPNSFFHVKLLEYKIYLSLYINDLITITSLFHEITHREWDPKHIKHCNINFEEWVAELKEKVSNRQQFLARINANKQDKKIAKLQSSELIG